jgi:hypothetical protein
VYNCIVVWLASTKAVSKKPVTNNSKEVINGCGGGLANYPEMNII